MKLNSTKCSQTSTKQTNSNVTHSKMIILSVTKNKGEGVKQHPLRNILPTFLGQGMKVGLKMKSCQEFLG